MFVPAQILHLLRKGKIQVASLLRDDILPLIEYCCSFQTGHLEHFCVQGKTANIIYLLEELRGVSLMFFRAWAE